ncbi:hypothetical protein PTKIN_Ptkin13bG0301400 [Pterospermum kingtungense]
MRSLKLIDGCKGTQVYALNSASGDGGGPAAAVVTEPLLPYGLPDSDLLEPQIEPCLKFVDFTETLADVYHRIEKCPQFEKSGMRYAMDVHSKIVLASWLRYGRREDELVRIYSMDCCGTNIECPKATLVAGYNPESIYDPCICSKTPRGEFEDDTSIGYEEYSTSDDDGDMSFCIGDDEIRCIRFCCNNLKSDCDAYLASFVNEMENALLLMEHRLEENAYLLMAACLQVLLRELPNSMHSPNVMKIFCSSDARERLARVGHASFLLYSFLSHIAMEEDMKSNTIVMLLERLIECAVKSWEKQLAYHMLGVVMLEKKEYKDAQIWFEAALEFGHIYSLVGVARAKFKRGHKYSAYKLINSLISDYKPVGWMHQERSLYCVGKEKMLDLGIATELDPTLSFPYKYRAVSLLEENKIGAAISKINKIIGFKVSTDCLELWAWISIAMEDFEGALRDQWSQADCWMQLYDRWSSVDDIGSLAVVHHMLANDPGKSLLRFRQSLLLLRLNCQKAAMHSLRLARNHSTSEHEWLVYEGWILYDTGYCEEALAKAEESISIQRSFEAFFLKAYALADSSIDQESSAYVIQLLEDALRCPSDGLRKGQILHLAPDCYMNALNIKHTQAHQGLARVFHLKNQHKAAYDEMTKLIEKARNNASAYEKRSEYCDHDVA